MFGKRGNDGGPFQRPQPSPARPDEPPRSSGGGTAVLEARPEPEAADTLVSERPAVVSESSAPRRAPQASKRPPEPPRPAPRPERERSESYYDTKSQVFSALIDTIDLSQLAKLDPDSAREEIRDIVNDIIAIKNFAMSISEQEELLEDICNDVLGYGPLEPLLARDEIADIMVNGAKDVYIEVGGKVEKTSVRFRDNQQLLNICQRIVSQVGRRVDESSPICDARLADVEPGNHLHTPKAHTGAPPRKR
jgi:pilus assembly protein CpaF